MIKYLITSFLFIFLLFGCEENSNEPDVQEEKAGSFNFEFLHSMKDNPINFESGLYTNQAGNNFYLRKLRYFLSGFKFEKSNGEIISYDSLYFLVDPANNENTFSIEDLEFDDFKSFSFNIGIDSATNHSNPALFDDDHPLSLINHNLHWGWTSGYIFFSIEGDLEFQGQTQGFTYHLGLDNNLIEFKFENITHSKNLNRHLLEFDLDKFFSSPNVIDQSQEVAVTHSINDNGLSERLVENLRGSFKYSGAIQYE